MNENLSISIEQRRFSVSYFNHIDDICINLYKAVNIQNCFVDRLVKGDFNDVSSMLLGRFTTYRMYILQSGYIEW